MAAAGYWVFSEAVAGGTHVPVPNVVGMEWLDAKLEIENAGLDVGQEVSVPNAEWPDYTVIGQRPQPGNMVREGRAINLTIAVQEQFSAIDNYVGQALPAVRTKIESSEFEIADIVRIPHPSEPQDTVLAQDPPYTGEASSSDKVSLLVSDGVPRGDLRMPDMRNRPLAEAIRQLSAQRIVANTEVDEELEGEVGVVLAQVPVPGTLLAEGTQVTLKYKPDPTVEEPEPAPGGLIEVTVSYQLPHAWYDREVRIDVTGSDNIRTTVYPRPEHYVNGLPPRHEAGTIIKQPIKYLDHMTVEVFLDDRLARTYRYGPNGEATIEDAEL